MTVMMSSMMGTGQNVRAESMRRPRHEHAGGLVGS